MGETDSASATWEISNFKDVTTSQTTFYDSKISCKNDVFFLGFCPKNKNDYLKNHVAIYLFRDPPRTAGVTVLWKIALLNKNGDECFAKDIETIFTVNNVTTNNVPPVYGGLYNLDRDIILDPSNRLLHDGKLVIKYKVLEYSKSPIADQKLQIANVKALEYYESLLESSKHSDVVFVVGGKPFKVHKAILSARSTVFRAMFESDLEESKKNRVEISDLEVEVFEELLRFIYGGKVEAMEKYAEDLLVLSDKYQLDSLKQLCEQSLSNNLTVENVAQVLTLADMHHAAELKSNCIEFITSNASKVTPTEGWKLLAKDLLIELYDDVIVKFEKIK